MEAEQAQSADGGGRRGLRQRIVLLVGTGQGKTGDVHRQLPTADELDAPLAEAVFSVTLSPGSAVTSVAPPRFSVAAVVPSNGLLLAVMPATVIPRGVMSPVALAVALTE